MDARELAALMADNAATIAQHLLPQGKKVTKEWKAGSIAGEPGQSLSVGLTGSKRGVWRDFNAGVGGDLLDLWGQCRALSVAEAMREAKQFLGVHDTMPARQAPTFKRPAKAKREAPKSVLGVDFDPLEIETGFFEAGVDFDAAFERDVGVLPAPDVE